MPSRNKLHTRFSLVVEVPAETFRKYSQESFIESFYNSQDVSDSDSAHFNCWYAVRTLGPALSAPLTDLMLAMEGITAG